MLFAWDCEIFVSLLGLAVVLKLLTRNSKVAGTSKFGIHIDRPCRDIACGCHNPCFNKLLEYLWESGFVKYEETQKKCIEKHSISAIFVGNIRPLKAGNAEKVEALGIHGGRVVEVGTESEVREAMGTINYSVIRLKSTQSIIPGMIEPHLHIISSVLCKGWIDLSPFQDQRLRKKYDLEWATKTLKKQDVKFIVAHGLDPSLMPIKLPVGGLNQLQRFDLQDLDAIRDDVPMIILSASMHTTYVNTAAVKKIYQVNRASLEITYPTLESFIKHVNDAGGLQEFSEMDWAISIIPILEKVAIGAKLFKNLDAYFQKLYSHGVTMIYDAGVNQSIYNVLKLYVELKRPKAHIGYAQLCQSLEDASKMEEYKEPNLGARMDQLFRGHVKLVSDGSNQGLTGYQHDPFKCLPPNNFGNFNFPVHSHPTKCPDYYRKTVETLAAKKWPVMIHCNGDAALDFTLESMDVFKKCCNKFRNRIEHCSLLTPERIKTLVDLNISPSFLIGHVGYWGYSFHKAIFGVKAEELDLCGSSLKAGLRISLHSDNSVSPLGPLRFIEQAVHRRMESDPLQAVLNGEECITIEQGLKAVTIDAAFQCYADKFVGSLERNKLADFVILENDLLDPTSYSKDIRDIKIQQTFIEGIEVFHAE